MKPSRDGLLDRVQIGIQPYPTDCLGVFMGWARPLEAGLSFKIKPINKWIELGLSRRNLEAARTEYILPLAKYVFT